jgi:hypothetical protein
MHTQCWFEDMKGKYSLEGLSMDTMIILKGNNNNNNNNNTFYDNSANKTKQPVPCFRVKYHSPYAHQSSTLQKIVIKNAGIVFLC